MSLVDTGHSRVNGIGFRTPITDFSAQAWQITELI